ncbi:DUF397 domain-containing protein [Streptomyces sp. NRRL S-4]|uniref:DUF397 domain-containing protein n=1 Tax=Streptomyces sp. NRRL S-4 TaxID=1519471 RepID=UPI0006B57967|nr:DUF397 domain-containing protein [Streptomyces sp. NRRL S-4]KPC84538.1 toxin [Streptomyces sp. NRRL S-4]
MISDLHAGDDHGLKWSKSSYSSNSSEADCVEVATACGLVHVRDSKSVPGPHLGFTPTTWENFVAHLSVG